MARGQGAIALSCACMIASFASLTHAQQRSPSGRHNAVVAVRRSADPRAERVAADVSGAELEAGSGAQSTARSTTGDDQRVSQDDDVTSADQLMTLRLGDITFRPRGEVRARLELRGRWLDAPEDRVTVSTRVRLGMEARWDIVRVVIDLQDARDMGLSPGSASGSTTGVFQGFFELGDGRSFARVGRQTIDVGAGRLVGSLNWASAARSFDAVRVRGALDAESTRPSSR